MRYFIVFFLLVASAVFAQQPKILSLNGYSRVAISAMTTDAKGNLYATGGYIQTADFGGKQVTSDDTSSGAYRFFVVKYDRNLNLIWLHTETGVANETFSNPVIDQGNSIILDKAGNIIISGTFRSTKFTLDGSFLTNADQMNNTEDIFFVKYTPDGKLLWLKGFGGTSVDIFGKMSYGPDEKIYLAGFTQSPSLVVSQITLSGTPHGDAVPILAVFDTNGTAIWAKSFPGRLSSGPFQTTGGNDKFFSAALDSIGNLYVTGDLNADTSQIGDSVIVRAGTDLHSFFIAKFAASDGHLIWEEHSNGVADVSAGQSAAADKNNNVIFCCGYTGASLKIAGLSLQNPAPQTFTSAAGIFKCNSSGAAIWGKVLGTTSGNQDSVAFFADEIGCSETNDIFVAGLALSTHPYVFGDSPLPLSRGEVNMYLLRIDQNGNLVWTVDGTFFGEGSGTSIVFMPDKTIYYSGFYGTLGQKLSFGGNNTLPFLNFISSFLLHLSSSTGIVAEDNTIKSESFAHPNPASMVTTIQLPLNSKYMDIYDALGRKIESISCANMSDVSIPCNNLSKGIYNFLVITNSGSVTSGKFIVN